MKAVISLFISVLVFFKSAQGFLSGTRQPTPCENSSNTAAVEHFFNMIFTEFHNTPPVCICVQMCVEQPTYCYPNGCLKKPEKKCIETKTVVDNINSIPNGRTPKSVMFLVENQKDFVDDINNYVEKTEKPQPMELIYRPNPFKELVLKYKKIPKLEMRYNLREQVKNMKLEKLKKDQIDVSKTRWPSNRHLLHGKQLINRFRDYRKSNEKRQSKFFVSMFPELESVTNYPKLYKKYLTKRENNNGSNIEAFYLYKTDAANFSLETLIDSLIENSLDVSKNKFDSKVSMFDEFENKSVINQNNIFTLTKGNSTGTLNTVNIISINSTNENIDSNKYLPNINTTDEKGNDCLEMIAIMSEEIDKQNRVSVDLMERVTGNRKIDVMNNISKTTPASLATIISNTNDKNKTIISNTNTNDKNKAIISNTNDNISTTAPTLATIISNTNNKNKTVYVRDNHIHTTNTTTIQPSVAHITSTKKSREVIVPVIRIPFMKGKQRIVRKIRNKNNVY